MSIPDMSISFNNNNYPMGQNQSIDGSDKTAIQSSPTEEILIIPTETTGETVDQLPQKSVIPDYTCYQREESGLSR